MPTAQELGLISTEDIGAPLEDGDTIEVTGLPEFKTLEKNGYEVVQLATTKGKRYTFSKSIIGSLKSENPQSTGAILKKAISQHKTLTLFVVENEANTGRTGVGLSLFKPRR